MAQVGIRELKEKASQILREVRERGEAYTITYQGKPCGLLLPYPTAGTKATKKGKGKGLVSLRGILLNTPEVPLEEFATLKKVWTKRVNELTKELPQAKESNQGRDG